jgi:hypothetical protein
VSFDPASRSRLTRHDLHRCARRRFRGGRVVDLACGHALIAQLMLLLDDTSPVALAVDVKLPPSAFRVADCLRLAWPRLAGRVTLLEARLDAVPAYPDDVLVSCHACGRLTDDVIDKALLARAKIVVLPCCQSTGKCDLGGLEGWLDPALAIDVTRAAKLRSAGYDVHTQTIPVAITPKNRLLLAEPNGSVGGQ